MQLKRSYYSLGGGILGLSIMVCTILGANITPFVKPFFSQFQSISVNDPRPVAAAEEMLENRHGVIITYEDPPYVHESEIKDQTDPAYRRAHPNGRRALVPKGGELEINYYMSSGHVRLDEIRSAILLLLDTHARKNNPGRFHLQQEGEIFHIIPTQYKDASGRLVSVEPILDTPISFPEQERSVIKTLELILDAVSKAKGVKCVIGTVPTNLLNRTTSRQGANNDKARDVLLSALKATNSKLSWRLFYGPGWKWYVLNVHGVPSSIGGPR